MKSLRIFFVLLSAVCCALFAARRVFAGEPKITVTYPEKSYSFASKLEIIISGEVENDDGLGTLTIGEKKFVLKGCKKAYFAEKLDLDLGKNRITVKATDRKEKNPVEQDIIVVFDDTPPKIVVTEPKSQALSSEKSEVNFKGTVTDDNMLWFLSIAGAEFDKIYKPKMEFSQAVKLKKGVYDYKITARDMGGNSATYTCKIEYEPELMRIAVSKFEAKDVSVTEAEFVANAVGSALVETKAFTLVEPNQKQLMQLQDTTYKDCVSQECAIKRGALLGANKVVMGILQSFGGEYHITVRMIDIETGEREFDKKMVAREKKDIDQVVTEIARTLAKEKGTK